MTDHIDADPHAFERLSENNHEHVHVMATHLEMCGSAGHFALDPQQSHQLAQALRSMAELADSNARAYNATVGLVEDRLREDEHQLWRTHQIKSMVKQFAAYAVIMTVIVWLAR